MVTRRRQTQDTDSQVTAVSVIFCLAQCKAYADRSRAKNQLALADIYEGFQLLLQEYVDDLTAGVVGRVLIDPVNL